ncbi:MAG: cadherin-like beta sandwich domain-containing protein, partial [Bacteroidales bacterium]|nr:cadherin-like beta sandwich domain-containing protein [Bacteroidales bacterium]
FDYTVNTDDKTKNILVTATPNHAKATVVSGNGTHALQAGNNTIAVTVKAEDGTTTKVYTITVKVTSTDAALQSLVIDKGTLTPAFSAGTFDYTVNTDDKTKNILVTATPNHAKATVVSGNGTHALQTGNNTIAVTVKAEDGTTTKVYTITVTVDKTNPAVSTDATLKDIIVDKGTLTPAFSFGTLNYAVNVNNKVKNIRVTATANHAKAKVVSGNGIHALRLGNNTINVTVKAEDGTTSKTYKITVTVDKEGQIIIFPEIPDKQISDAPFKLSASTNSGLPLTYSSNSPDIAEVTSDGTVSVKNAGEASITVRQAGNDYFHEASVTRTFTVYPATSAGEATEQAAFGVYPNPVSANDVIRLTIDRQPDEAVVKVYNMAGALIRQHSITERSTLLQAPSVQGVYLYILQMKNGYRKQQRVVVR